MQIEAIGIQSMMKRKKVTKLKENMAKIYGVCEYQEDERKRKE